MKKQEIIDDLIQKHQKLYDWLDNQPEKDWIKGPENKWNTGEHIVHLIQSEKTLNKALWIPKFYLKYKFKVNNRENRTYNQIVNKYLSKLEANKNLISNISKKMPEMKISNKKHFISKLDNEKIKLIKKIKKWNENDLDTYLLPHPLLGRMTIREIIMWTSYHTEQHFNILKSHY